MIGSHLKQYAKDDDPVFTQAMQDIAATFQMSVDQYHVTWAKTDYRVDPNDHEIVGWTINKPVTITLPDGSQFARGKHFHIKRVGPHPVTINCVGRQTIDEEPVYTIIHHLDWVRVCTAPENDDWWIICERTGGATTTTTTTSTTTTSTSTTSTTTTSTSTTSTTTTSTTSGSTTTTTSTTTTSTTSTTTTSTTTTSTTTTSTTSTTTTSGSTTTTTTAEPGGSCCLPCYCFDKDNFAGSPPATLELPCAQECLDVGDEVCLYAWDGFEWWTYNQCAFVDGDPLGDALCETPELGEEFYARFNYVTDNCVLP